MSSKLLEYSSRKVCARYYGQNQRFRSFSTVDPTTRKACRLLCSRKFRIVRRVGGKVRVRVRVSRVVKRSGGLRRTSVDEKVGESRKYFLFLEV